jgi:chromosome segregation ATPase
VEEIVLAKIRDTLRYVRENKEAFAEQVRKLSSKETEKAIKSKTSELTKADRRIADLDKIIKRIYEDHVAEKLSDERFNKMLADYEEEQAELVTGTAGLRQEVEELRGRIANAQSFIKLCEPYTEITELTAEAARTFIEKVVVHEAVYSKNPKQRKAEDRVQKVDILFNCIGEFEPE